MIQDPLGLFISYHPSHSSSTHHSISHSSQNLSYYFAAMAIKVLGNPFSPATKRVLLCLAEKGIDYEFVAIDFATGQQKQEPLISINPFGQVPGFEDGDLKLFESRAINRYIANTYAEKGTPLISADDKKMAVIGVWMEVEALRFDAAAQKLNYEILVKPMKGQTTDEAVVEQLQSQLAGVLDVYEAHLSKSNYLAGNDFTLADLHHIPIIANLIKTKVKSVFEARPAVAAWAATLLARPASQKVLS